MLKAFQNTKLRTSPDEIKGGFFACVEVSKDDNTSQMAIDQQIVAKPLQETEVEDWAFERGSFAPSVPDQRLKPAAGACRIRILFGQSKSTFRHAIPEVLTSGTVLQALGLPSHTLSAFQVDSGIYSSHCSPEGSAVANCSSQAFVFRTPQLKDCTIGGLSVSHDFEKGLTTALILGYAFDLHQPQAEQKALESFLQQIKDCQQCWGHALLLPCLFLVEHAQRVQNYAAGALSRRVVLVEHSIGITTTGRSGMIQYDFPSDWQHANDQRLFTRDLDHMQRRNAKKLVATINDLSTTIIFAQRSPEWDIATIALLSQALEHKRLQDLSSVANNTFHETLEYLRHYCGSSEELVRSSRARVELQLNILYTSIAQDDGQTGARLAASAGKDSTSMKIIALITAAYLPGTFVATLFSMGMFDWQTTTVSSSFYIYWAVTIPLTIVTLAGWALWWGFELKRFEREVQQAVEDKPTPKYFPSLKP